MTELKEIWPKKELNLGNKLQLKICKKEKMEKLLLLLLIAKLKKKQDQEYMIPFY